MEVSELTPVQRRAVEWGRGPLMILAGPGSGKTGVLTHRIAKLLVESPQESFRILALTFTNKAADEMKERVERLAPGNSNRLFLGTFHAFCADVLRQHGSHLGIQPDFRIYASKRDREAVLREGISSKPGFFETSDAKALPIIDRLLSDLVAPEEAEARLGSAPIGGRIEELYRSYLAALRRSNALDFSLLIFKACELFRRFPMFAKRYRTVYPYWCVDEFQDTNVAQFALLRLMAGDAFRELFVVADDDQIIFQWNGASYKRLDEFRSLFSPSIIQLPTNYRCPPEVVDLANNLIQYNDQRTKGKISFEAAKPSSGSHDVVRVLSFADEDEEMSAVARDIAQKFPRGMRSATAVVSRGRRELEFLKDALSEHDICGVLSQRRDEFRSAPFRWLYACLRQSLTRADESGIELIAATFAQMGGPDIDVQSLVARAKSGHGDFLREWCNVVLESRVYEDTGIVQQVLDLIVRQTAHKAFVDAALGGSNSSTKRRRRMSRSQAKGTTLLRGMSFPVKSMQLLA